MTNGYPPFKAVSQQFSNFELFSQLLRGYDLDLVQLDRGAFRSSLTQIECGEVYINHIKTTRRLEASGSPPPGLMTFGVPTNDCLPFYWRNQFSDGNTIQVYRPATELSMVSSPFFEAIDVSIDEDALNGVAANLGLPDIDRIVCSREMIACQPQQIATLRSLLRFICSGTSGSSNRSQAQFVSLQMIRTQVPELLLRALSSDEHADKKPGYVARNRALKLATEYFDRLSYEDCSLARFCGDTGINQRTLQRAFAERYGLSPKSYLKALNLNKVYKSLLNADPESTRIADVASEHGFWHMSQFARDYRLHFGELPSSTLAKSSWRNPLPG